MSITLMAYPMAFLIAPEKAPKEELKIKISDDAKNAAIGTKNLKFIKVLSNLTSSELKHSLPAMDIYELQRNHYCVSATGLDIVVSPSGKYTIFTMSGTINAEHLQKYSEGFFTDLDRIAGKNVRLLGNKEIFYYVYTTEYTSQKEIYNVLKEQKATQIFSTNNDEIVANVDNQSIRYYKEYSSDTTYLLEVEQKISIMNIGVNEDEAGMYSSYALTNLKIKTNIKKSELKKFLKAAKYGFYEANGQTPLRNSYATLNWVEQDGYYVAEFSGQNNTAITKEAENIFRKINIAAGRDVRMINDVSTTIYTYNTNYTDKGVLLNTLYEHGAEEIKEEDEIISCKLFNMTMKYYKSETGAYILDITQISDKSECEDIINDLNEEYGLNIQEITYNKIKERLEQENLHLDDETVLDDNSIVLTIDI